MTTMPLKLKAISPSQLPPLDPSCTSSTLHPSSVSISEDVRDHYLSNPSLVPPPLISCSPFVPQTLAAHLMRKKKDMAIGVKFNAYSGTDQITNMEGAMHSFVTPVVPRCEMVGDYVFWHGHGVAVFGTSEEKGADGKNVRLTRSVVLSASIQLDFELAEVMMAVSSVGEKEIVGRDLLEHGKWEILSVERKQHREEREKYDAELRAHMVFHLTNSHALPDKSQVQQEDIMSSDSATTVLETLIKSSEDPSKALEGKFLTVGSRLLSLELLCEDNAALQQARNEFSALEALCPQGYVYTYDPASIFAGRIGAKILNRLMLCGLRTLSKQNTFSKMKIFAFNEYAEPRLIPLVRTALQEQEVRVLRKEDLFQGKGQWYDIGKFPGCEGAMLVVHNNSDGFGQNVETEGTGGSLDGAIGASSSAAASLNRLRNDLMDFIC